jgi:hypothetical protein
MLHAGRLWTGWRTSECTSVVDEPLKVAAESCNMIIVAGESYDMILGDGESYDMTPVGRLRLMRKHIHRCDVKLRSSRRSVWFEGTVR